MYIVRVVTFTILGITNKHTHTHIPINFCLQHTLFLSVMFTLVRKHAEMETEWGEGARPEGTQYIPSQSQNPNVLRREEGRDKGENDKN